MSTELHTAGGSAATTVADAVVIGLLPAVDGGADKAPPRLAPGADEVDAAFDGGLAELLAVAGATGKAEEVVKLPTRGAITAPLLVAVGLGEPRDGGAPAPEQVRRAAGAAARSLTGTDRAACTLGRLDSAAAAEGALLGAYTFTAYKSGNGRVAVCYVDLLCVWYICE